MAALLILPLLLIFGLSGLVDAGGSSGSDTEADTDTPQPDTETDTDGDQQLGIGELDISRTTDADDRVLGAQGPDAIGGQGGNDSLLGLAGDDILEGARGNDFLRGGEGDDVLTGDEGDDTLIGGLGTDLIAGGDGDDSLNGQAGVDVLYGGSGADTLEGGGGTDYLYSFMGNNNGPVPDNLVVTDIDANFELAYDQVSAQNPDASPGDLIALVEAAGYPSTSQDLTQPDGQPDVLRGGGGRDFLFLGAGDNGTGDDGSDRFIVHLDNQPDALSVVEDFSSDEDDLLVIVGTGTSVTLDLVPDGNDVIVRTIESGDIARIVGGVGSFTNNDINYVRIPPVPSIT